MTAKARPREGKVVNYIIKASGIWAVKDSIKRMRRHSVENIANCIPNLGSLGGVWEGEGGYKELLKLNSKMNIPIRKRAKDAGLTKERTQRTATLMKRCTTSLLSGMQNSITRNYHTPTRTAKNK